MIDKINDTKMKLGSRVTLRKTGKTKVDSEISAKAVNSAKRKCVEEVMDMEQGDDRLPGTDRTVTDVMMAPPILMAGLRYDMAQLAEYSKNPLNTDPFWEKTSAEPPLEWSKWAVIYEMTVFAKSGIEVRSLQRERSTSKRLRKILETRISSRSTKCKRPVSTTKKPILQHSKAMLQMW